MRIVDVVRTSAIVLAGLLTTDCAAVPAPPRLSRRNSAPIAPAHGRLETFPLPSAALGLTVSVRVYLPPGYTTERRYPALYALQSGVYFDRLKLPEWIDAAVARGAPAAVVVGLPDAETLEASRPDTLAGDAYVRCIADEVIPAVEGRYATRRERDGRLLLGFSAGANVLLDMAVRRPDRFARVAAVSPGWMLRDDAGAIDVDFHAAAVARARAAPRGALPAFWFTWGDAPSEWESRSRSNGAELVAALRAQRAAVIVAPLAPGDHGLGLARATLSDAIAFLLARQ